MELGLAPTTTGGTGSRIWIARVAGAVAILSVSAGILVVAGWALGIPRLSNALPGVTMKVNTAVAFASCGISLLLANRTPRNRALALAGAVVASLVVALGVATLLQYAPGLDLGIDQALFREPPNVAGALQPGRMAPNTAAAFTFVGLAIATLFLPAHRFRRARQGFAVATALIAALALTDAFFVSARNPAAVDPYRQMAIYTGVLFLALSIGVLCTRPDEGVVFVLLSPGLGGAIARRLVPAVVAVPLLLAWLRLQGERAALYETEFGVSLMAVATVAMLFAFVMASAAFLDRVDRGRRAAELALREAKDAAEATSQELEAFSYSVSHDLRAPLRAIDGFARALDEDCGSSLDDTGRGYVNRIRAGAQRMALLIDSLLSLSRVTRATLSTQQTNLSAVVEDVFQSIAPADRVTLRCPEGIVAQGDPTLLRVAIENLVGNAVKFTSKTEGARVEFGRLHSPDGPVYFVADNGVGFDERYAGKLFGAFQRLHSPSEFEGTGIGLATTARVIRRHGGRIWATSAVGQGATFFFTLTKRVGSP